MTPPGSGMISGPSTAWTGATAREGRAVSDGLVPGVVTAGAAYVRGNFSWPVHAHFKNGNFMFLPEFQEGKGKPHQVIEVALGFQH